MGGSEGVRGRDVPTGRGRNVPALPTPEALALLEFARPSRAEHGFGWLDDDGNLDPSRPVFLWVTGRMTHCFALGALMGVAGCLELTRHGVAALTGGALRDAEHPGWFSAVELDGTPVPGPKVSYDHSFVVLAASSALAAGIGEAADLLADAFAVVEGHWWDPTFQMVTDQADRDFSATDPYRGANANMHMVEAFLAAAAATGDDAWLDRALAITTRMGALLQEFHGRLPEHFDAQWNPLPDFNRETPADAFRPYGSTVGHWLEWSRLMLHIRAELAERGREVPRFLDVLPPQMYRQSLAEGWAPDGHEGFVYTVDFDGTPVVRQRMHWVLTEAIGAAASLHALTGEAQYAADIARFRDYAARHLIERPGAWHPELGPDNTPAAGTWAGKPDIYHALQSEIVDQLPSAPPFAWALRTTHST